MFFIYFKATNNFAFDKSVFIKYKIDTRSTVSYASKIYSKSFRSVRRYDERTSFLKLVEKPNTSAIIRGKIPVLRVTRTQYHTSQNLNIYVSYS